MQLASTLDAAPRVVASPEGGDYRVTDLFSAPLATGPGPQCFYVESLTPSSTIRPHFHVVDQFQVFLEGDGRLGSAPVEPVLVHYSDAYTPYGPIVAGPVGVRYMTLRTAGDPGGRPMPEARQERLRLGGRHITVRIPTDAPPGGFYDLVAPHGDGLAVHVLDLGPGEARRAPSPSHGGRHILVVSGGLVLEGRIHPRGSVVYGSPSDEPLEVVAAEEGLSLLVLQFPEPDRPGRPASSGGLR